MRDDTLRRVQELFGSRSGSLPTSSDEQMVRLRVHHIPLTETGGTIHTTYSEWKPIGEPFSLNTQSFGNIIQVAVRYGAGPDR